MNEIRNEHARWRVERYLKDGIRPLMDSIDEKLYRIKECESRLELMGIDYSKASAGGGSSDVICDGVARIRELREELAAEVAHGIHDIEEARSLCPRSEPQRYILWLHYVQGMTWAKAARAIGLGPDHVKHKLVPQGMEELVPMIPLEYQDRVPEAHPECRIAPGRTRKSTK